MGRCYTSLRLASNQDHDSGASLPKAGAGNLPASPPLVAAGFSCRDPSAPRLEASDLGLAILAAVRLPCAVCAPRNRAQLRCVKNITLSKFLDIAMLRVRLLASMLKQSATSETGS
jgi:hypothetical protein